MAKKQGFKGKVREELFKGTRPQDIFKQLRLEYSAEKKFIQNWKKDSGMGKNYFEKALRKINEAQKTDYRQLNPAREQLKELKKINLTKTKIIYKQVSRVDTFSGAVYGAIESKRIERTKYEIKSIEKFKENFERKSKNAIRRFGRYGKAINLNKITVNFRGEDISITRLYKDYMQTNDKYLKGQITRKINKAYEELKKVKVSQASPLRERIYRGRIEDIKNGDLQSNYNQGYTDTTVDQNGNVFGWDINPSKHLIFSGELVYHGEGSIIWDQHLEQLNNMQAQTDEVGFLQIWRRLQNQYS